MYSLPYHKEKDPQRIREFVAQYPFAFLSGCDVENKPVVSQVPVFLEETEGKTVLRGHIMKATDHYKAFQHNPNVKVVFTGPNCYVSGTWYSNPHTPSTWNYMSVHASGHIRFLDQEGLIEVLRKTSLHFESYNAQSTTLYDRLIDKYKTGVLHMIAAFEVEVVELDNVFKLSQDRDRESYHSIIEKLQQQGGAGEAIAAEMKKREGEVFT